MVALIGSPVGAAQVFAGLTLVNRVGGATFGGITVTGALVMSLVVDHFGRFRIRVHPVSMWRIVGGLLMVGRVSLISRF
jgi:transporter family-2 protein